MTISHDVANRTLSKRHTITEAHNQFRSTQLLCSICCHWNQWEQKANCGTTRKSGLWNMLFPKIPRQQQYFLFWLNLQSRRCNISTSVLASFLPPPALTERHSRNKALRYYCTYFNLETEEVMCSSPHSTNHYLWILLTQNQVACGGLLNAPPSREDNMLWSYFKNISFTKVSNLIFRDRDDFLAASTSLLAWHLLQREFICCSNIKMEQEQLPGEG